MEIQYISTFLEQPQADAHNLFYHTCYMNCFYRYYGVDEDVLQDRELQSFMNELSIKGRRPPNSGIGRVRCLDIVIEFSIIFQ